MFDKSLNAASCQPAISTESVRTAIEPKLKYLKANQIPKEHRNCAIFEIAQFFSHVFVC